MNYRKFLSVLVCLLLPKKRKPAALRLMGHEVEDGVSIGPSFVWSHLRLSSGASIGPLNVIKVEELRMGPLASIGTMNWLTSPSAARRERFRDSSFRGEGVLVLLEGAAITSRHLVDVTSSVTVGRGSIVAGYRSQLITHAVDLHAVRQKSACIRIGDGCFLGTGCIVLPGILFPPGSVLAAGSVLVGSPKVSGLYGGSPARLLREGAYESFMFRSDYFID